MDWQLLSHNRWYDWKDYICVTFYRYILVNNICLPVVLSSTNLQCSFNKILLRSAKHHPTVTVVSSKGDYISHLTIYFVIVLQLTVRICTHIWSFTGSSYVCLYISAIHWYFWSWHDIIWRYLLLLGHIYNL